MRVKERKEALELELAYLEDEIMRLERAGEYDSYDYDDLCEQAGIISQDLDAMNLLDDEDEY